MTRTGHGHMFFFFEFDILSRLMTHLSQVPSVLDIEFNDIEVGLAVI